MKDLEKMTTKELIEESDFAHREAALANQFNEDGSGLSNYAGEITAVLIERGYYVEFTDDMGRECIDVNPDYKTTSSA